MGRSSSKLLEKPHNPLQEMQYKELQRERSRCQQQKEKKQILRLQQKQARKQRKTNKRKQRLTRNKTKDQQSGISRRDNGDNLEPELSFNCHTMRYDLRHDELSQQLETRMQNQLNEDLCQFILNQIALSMEFFQNYEGELSTMADEMLNSEKLFNRSLAEHTILLANPLDVAASKSIRYKPKHGTAKHGMQLLQTQIMYVVFENIDIVRPNDANYDSISPLCKVDMELDFRETTPCKEEYVQLLNDIKWKGYVRLRLREDTKQSTKTLTEDSEDVYSEGSSGYGTSSPYSSRMDSSAEPDYDYAFISYLNTQHPLKELKMSNVPKEQGIDAKVLPESCISALGSFVQPLQEEEFTDDEENSESEYADSDGCVEVGVYRDFDTLQAIKLYRMELEKRRKLLSQNYLNSGEFMRYFGELVSKHLATKLNITPAELTQATYRGTSIHTSRYELIPAIYAAQNVADWPKCAFEFRLRDRPIATNPQTGQQMQWPTRAMIKRIETFGFHLIPLGYSSKKQHNPFRDIEWRIVFPKAERYLEQHLTNAQVKVYMITKALIKCFVEPQANNKALMFASDHLRTHLFWECENHCTAWPEEFLGEVLMRFISSFKQRVKQKHLSDYFIRERNLFENIPEYSLNTLHTILADITANPLMHVMIALRNLDYGTAYFPKLNFKKLYANLVANDLAKLKMLAKNARSLMDFEAANENGSCVMPDEGAKGLVSLRQHQVRTNGKLRRKTQLLRHNLERRKQEMAAKRDSVESIDVEFFFRRNMKSTNAQQFNQGMENLRRTNILEIVLDHLLEMTTKAIEFRNVVMAKKYLRQARRLCKCYHNYGCDMGAKEYLASIHNLDEELQIIYNQEDFANKPPSLPRRLSVELVLPEVSHGLKVNHINLYEEMAAQEGTLSASDIRKKLKEYNDRGKTKEKAETNSKTNSPLQIPEARKSIKFNSSEVASGEKDVNPGEGEIKTCLKSSSITPVSMRKTKSPQPKKSIKFQNEIIAVDERGLVCQDSPQGYRPNSIPKFNQVAEQKLGKNPDNKVPRKAELEEPSSDDFNHTEQHSLIPTYLGNKFKSFSVRANSELLKNISQNTNHFLQQLTAEEKTAQIREMLKRKTLQIKGAFNQSSDT